jgi:membrane protease subunit HflC
LINSEAYRKAQIIKGEADADATRIYASAYGIDPEFYSFIRTLEVYGETMDEDSTLILSTDSEFLKYFKSLR